MAMRAQPQACWRVAAGRLFAHTVASCRRLVGNPTWQDSGPANQAAPTKTPLARPLAQQSRRTAGAQTWTWRGHFLATSEPQLGRSRRPPDHPAREPDHAPSHLHTKPTPNSADRPARRRLLPPPTPPRSGHEAPRPGPNHGGPSHCVPMGVPGKRVHWREARSNGNRHQRREERASKGVSNADPLPEAPPVAP